MEQSLIQAQREYRALVDNSQDAISRVQRDGRDSCVNRQIIRMTGFTEEQIVGKTPLEAGFRPDAATRLAEGCQRVLQTGVMESEEYRRESPDGDTVWEPRIVPR